MDILNLDYECYLHAIKKHRNYQEDWLTRGYAPKGFYLKDFCILERDEVYHLFHIAGTPGVSCCLPGNEIWFGHATTRDFLAWETLEPCLYIDHGSWDGGHLFAPYVVAKDGDYWMFYTGCKIDNTQRIGVAFSKDLTNWERILDRPVICPEEYDWAFCPVTCGSCCRDPHVCKWGNEYSMYYTAVTKEGRACVARTASNDLVNWSDKGPAFVYSGLKHCESSNVQELDGKYLLFFGGHHEYWSFVISDHPEHWPEQNPIPLAKKVTGMEVIRRRGSQWLVAYFKFDAYRLFLGIIDWTEAQPKISEIGNKGKLLQFF